MPTAVEREAQAIKSEAKKILLIVVIISVIVYAFSGTRQVPQEQTGLILRFGRVVKTRTDGLHWGLPWPIDKVVLVPTGASHTLQVDQFRLDPETASARRADLLKNRRFKTLGLDTISGLVDPFLVTADMNVVHLNLKVVYQITDPQAYYEVAGDAPDMTDTRVQEIAQRVIAEALIRTVAEMEVMNVLTEGQTAIQTRVRQITNQRFEELNLGIAIRGDESVAITTVGVPAALQRDFDLVTTARQTSRNERNVAEAQGQQILDEAQAMITQIRTEAEVYGQSTVRQARGDAQRYADLIEKYHQQGQVIRDRLQYEKLAEVAPYLKAPTIHTIPNDNGSQRLIISIPGEPE